MIADFREMKRIVFHLLYKNIILWNEIVGHYFDTSTLNPNTFATLLHKVLYWCWTIVLVEKHVLVVVNLPRSCLCSHKMERGKEQEDEQPTIKRRRYICSYSPQERERDKKRA